MLLRFPALRFIHFSWGRDDDDNDEDDDDDDDNDEDDDDDDDNDNDDYDNGDDDDDGINDMTRCIIHIRPHYVRSAVVR